MNVQSARGKSGTKRILGYRLVIEVARFAVGSDILAQQRIVFGHRIDQTKNFHLKYRRLHQESSIIRDEPSHRGCPLQKMKLDAP